MRNFRDLSEVYVYGSMPHKYELLNSVAEWSDRWGCRGLLIYTANALLDPWILAQEIISRTGTLRPLVALQPIYLHPYAAALKIQTLERMYGRPVDLNLVAGGFRFDLAALGDRLSHDARYDRLSEYGQILLKLLRGEEVSFSGSYYNVQRLSLPGKIRSESQPLITIAGSSDAGRRCAAALGAIALTHPQPPEAQERNRDLRQSGIRLGVIARETKTLAWKVASAFIEGSNDYSSRTKAAMAINDSSWRSQLVGSTSADTDKQDVYWMTPFQRGISFSPFLVGSYEDVAEYLHSYKLAGVKVLILELMHAEEEYRHAFQAVSRVFC